MFIIIIIVFISNCLPRWLYNNNLKLNLIYLNPYTKLEFIGIVNNLQNQMNYIMLLY